MASFVSRLSDRAFIQRELRNAISASRASGVQIQDEPDGASLLGEDVASKYDGLGVNVWWQPNFIGLVAYDYGPTRQSNIEFKLLGNRKTQACLAEIDGAVWLLHTGQVFRGNPRPTSVHTTRLDDTLYYKVARIGDPEFFLNILAFYRSALGSFGSKVTDVEGDLEDDFSALEGVDLERLTRIKSRATRLANEFVWQREKAGTLVCQHCNFDPSDLAIELSTEPRAFLDVHHTNPLAEGVRHTELTDFALLCPTCHRVEHARLRAQSKTDSPA